VVAAVAPDPPPRPVDDVAGALAQVPVLRQEPRAPGARQEAQVLRVGLGRDRQPGLGKRSRSSVARDRAASMYVWSFAGSAAARRRPSAVRRA
jgi:hypothetical protein